MDFIHEETLNTDVAETCNEQNELVEALNEKSLKGKTDNSHKPEEAGYNLIVESGLLNYSQRLITESQKRILISRESLKKTAGMAALLQSGNFF